MKAQDRHWVTGLLAAAVFIWFRDRRWMTEADDVLPALAALPLAFWLGHPWRFQTPTHPPSRRLLLACTTTAILGAALNLTLLLALAWTGFLWAFLEARIPAEARTSTARLLVLPFHAFPWVTLDLQAVGWWFRLTGAQATEWVCHGLGLDIAREGTHLVVQGMPVSVDAACAGLHAFQSMLIAGSFLAFALLGTTRAYWWNILLLPALAWVANTVRILAITAAAVTCGQEFAMGLFHTWGGLFVLLAMFAACGALFHAQSRHLPLPQPLPNP